jgi:hypothetical protein
VYRFLRKTGFQEEGAEKQPSRGLILHDLHITPPNTSAEAKYYVGFYNGDLLVAIMDLIDGYPDSDTAFIGFFMMNRQLQ